MRWTNRVRKKDTIGWMDMVEKVDMVGQMNVVGWRDTGRTEGYR